MYILLTCFSIPLSPPTPGEILNPPGGRIWEAKLEAFWMGNYAAWKSPPEAPDRCFRGWFQYRITSHPSPTPTRVGVGDVSKTTCSGKHPQGASQSIHFGSTRRVLPKCPTNTFSTPAPSEAPAGRFQDPSQPPHTCAGVEKVLGHFGWEVMRYGITPSGVIPCRIISHPKCFLKFFRQNRPPNFRPRISNPGPEAPAGRFRCPNTCTWVHVSTYMHSRACEHIQTHMYVSAFTHVNALTCREAMITSTFGAWSNTNKLMIPFM